MKSRIASALAVLAIVGALAACSGKGSAGPGGTAPAGAGMTATSTASSTASSTATSSAPGSTDSHGVAADPDGDLNSLDQQLSDINGALSSAEPTQTAGDN
jgi:hypothetical protein